MKSLIASVCCVFLLAACGRDPLPTPVSVPVVSDATVSTPTPTPFNCTWIGAGAGYVQCNENPNVRINLPNTFAWVTAGSTVDSWEIVAVVSDNGTVCVTVNIGYMNGNSNKGITACGTALTANDAI